MMQEAFRAYLEEAIGRENALVAFSAFEQPASVAVRMNPFKTSGVFDGEPVQWSKWGRILEERPLFTLDPHFHGGAYYVQDSSSMFVGEVFRQCLESMDSPVGRPVRVLDLCAAPGGKASHLAEKLQGTGMVEARDLTEYKVSLIEENIERHGLTNMKAVQMDATILDKESIGKADILICDLPCSGLGVLGKKTDLKYILRYFC